MKKALMCLFVVLTCLNCQSQDDFYNLSFVSSSGATVGLSGYRGKKVMIVVTSLDSLNAKTDPRYLGKIQSQFPEVSLLVMPIIFGMDTAGAANANTYPELNNTVFGALAVIGNGQPTDYSQYPLLQWLMNGRNGQHFQKGSLDDEQFFFVSESGILYAVLEKDVPDGFMQTVLTAPDVKQ